MIITSTDRDPSEILSRVGPTNLLVLMKGLIPDMTERNENERTRLRSAINALKSAYDIEEDGVRVEIHGGGSREDAAEDIFRYSAIAFGRLLPALERRCRDAGETEEKFQARLISVEWAISSAALVFEGRVKDDPWYLPDPDDIDDEDGAESTRRLRMVAEYYKIQGV